MTSLRARLVNLALPLLGIKRFFGEPEKMPERIAKLRRQKPIRPRAKWHRQFTIREDADRGFALVTIEPPGGHRLGAPHLLYLHGGGYVMDIAAVHWDAVADLCERLGASASVPLYPLAPEHKAADTLAQMRALYLDLATLHGAANITVMGDSAGGGMSLALAQMLKAEGAPLPGSLVLYSPWLDATATAEGQRAIERRDKAADTLAQMRTLYLDLATLHGAANITVMGDSAGGGMSLALAQMLKAEGAPLPGSLVLYSPWLDATATAEGPRAIERRDRMLAVAGLEACGEMYRGDLPVDDPRVSPLFGPLEDLPPMAIFSGTSDILLVDGRRLAEKLDRPGMPAHIYREYQDMFHVWMLLPLPEAQRARSETVDFIRQHRISE